MTTITIPRETFDQMQEALEEACGNRCNAEYNPCYAREAVGLAREALSAAKAVQPQPFGWFKQSELDQAKRFGGSINLWLEKYDCDKPVFPHPQASEPAWMPIETAPKDFVTEFDGWNGERVPNVSWAHPEYSTKGHYAWCVSEYESHNGWVNREVTKLTHWMPLPAAPEATK